jgi:hypothetical protein
MFFVLAGLAFTAVAVMMLFAVVGLALKLAFRLILLPLLLVKWLVMGVVMLVVGPILFVVGAVAAIAFGLALFVPLLPLFAVAAIVWLIVRANRQPAVA